MESALECRRLSPDLAESLAEFFRALSEAGDARHFHPHPFTKEEATKLSRYSGKDLYYVMVEGNQIIGYGFLRGWDEGYEIPGLGLALHPKARGTGMGRTFMHFLQSAAKRRGARKIRVRIHPENEVTLTLHRDLGYKFESEDRGQLVGILDL